MNDISIKFKVNYVAKNWAALPRGFHPQSIAIQTFVSIGSHVQKQYTTLGVETGYEIVA